MGQIDNLAYHLVHLFLSKPVTCSVYLIYAHILRIIFILMNHLGLDFFL